MLVAWGITTDGKPVLSAWAPGRTESTDAWAGFLSDMAARGLRAPLLVISDGAPGLIAAAEAVRPSLRQRCLIHRARNILAKVPKRAPGRGEGRVLEDLRHRQPSPVRARSTRPATGSCFAQRSGQLYPAAVECLEGRLRDTLSSTCGSRPSTGSRIRHSNFIERTFGETRRRVKVIGRLPGERSCLSLVWAVLDRASRGWRGVKHTPATTRLLADLRRQLMEPPVSIAPVISTEEAADNTVTAVA